MVIGCFVVTLLRMDERPCMSLIHLSLVLEVAALVAQSSLSQGKLAWSPTVRFFFNSWFFSKAFMTFYYVLLTFASLYRYRVTYDEGFHYFGTHGYHSICYVMLLGYCYNYASLLKIQKELKKPNKVSDGRSFL